MTTIAYRDGVLSADTQCTWSETIYRVSKLVRLPCGGVIGGCGNFSELNSAFNWFKGGCKGKAPKIKESTVIAAFGDGRLCVTMGRKLEMEPITGPVAIGSGQQAAMAAMLHFGCNSVEAVEAAARVCPYTSAPIESMAVEPKKPTRKRAK